MVYESSESANNLLSYVASASTNHTSARRTLELWTCDNDGEGEAELKDTQWACGPFRGGKAFRPINGFTPFVCFNLSYVYSSWKPIWISIWT